MQKKNHRIKKVSERFPEKKQFVKEQSLIKQIFNRVKSVSFKSPIQSFRRWRTKRKVASLKTKLENLYAKEYGINIKIVHKSVVNISEAVEVLTDYFNDNFTKTYLDGRKTLTPTVKSEEIWRGDVVPRNKRLNQDVKPPVFEDGFLSDYGHFEDLVNEVEKRKIKTDSRKSC